MCLYFEITREPHILCHCNSITHPAIELELFKPLKDVASLPVRFFKKLERLDFVFLWVMS